MDLEKRPTDTLSYFRDMGSFLVPFFLFYVPFLFSRSLFSLGLFSYPFLGLFSYPFKSLSICTSRVTQTRAQSQSDSLSYFRDMGAHFTLVPSSLRYVTGSVVNNLLAQNLF